MIREFHLSPPGEGRGIWCDARGAFVGAIPILNRLRKNGKDEWQPRDCERLSEEIGAHYGLPIDMSPKTGGLRAIAKALSEGDVARAQIATVLLGIPDPPQLSKCACPREEMIKLICDLHWSGLIKLDGDENLPAGNAVTANNVVRQRHALTKAGYNPDEPRDERGRWTSGGGGSVEPHTDGQSTRILLADAGISDASDDPVAEAAARAALAVRRDGLRQTRERDDTPNIVLAAAEGEDENDPRFGIGGNHPPPEEFIPQRLQQSPAGPVVQYLDNLLGIRAPGDEANLEVAELQQRALLQRIREIDPSYVYESIEPRGGLAGMSWQGRLNVINGLRADLAAAIYRVRGDIRPLQEVTLDFMQRTTNAAYDKAVQRYNAGELKVHLSREVAIGNDVDSAVRLELREFYNRLRIEMGPGLAIRVNRRAYNSSGAAVLYRLPDARVGNFAFDVSLTAKKSSDRQIRGFFNADFKPVAVVIVRPNQLGNPSSYIIWRPRGG